MNETYPANTFEYHEKYNHQKLRFGDVERAFASADFVLEERYQMSPIEHAPTETNGSIAAPETNDRFVVHTCTQALFFSLGTAAKLLDVPSNRLHFIGGTVGGGFGGKVDSLTEPLSILGAMLTGRPVRYVLGREEEMLYGCPRGAERHTIKDGVMRDGRIVARKVTSYFDAGAYTRLSSYGAVKCIAHVPGPYTIPNVHANSYCVFTNRTPATAMRGFGITGVDFALEVQMDKLAHKVGMDPMEFRILNAYRDGDMKAHRREAHNCALIECVQVAAEKAGWPIRDEYRRMNSLTGGGGERAVIPATATDEAGRIGAGRPAGSDAASRAPAIPISPPPRVPQPVAAQPRVAPPPRPQRRHRHRRLRHLRRASSPSPPLPPRSTAPHASPACSARAGGSHGQASRTRHGVDQLPDRHEPGRRPEPGAGPFQSGRQIHGHPLGHRPRPGYEAGDAPDCGRDPGRAHRRRVRGHGRLRHRSARHGQLRLARHAPRRQRRDGGCQGSARRHDGGRRRGAGGQRRRPRHGRPRQHPCQAVRSRAPSRSRTWPSPPSSGRARPLPAAASS